MRLRPAIFCALLIVASPRFALAQAQDEGEKAKKEEAAATDTRKGNSMIAVPIKISAEDKPSLPLGSNVEWQGVGKTCSAEEGKKSLNSEGEALLNLPFCKVKLVVFITGFDTKTVTLEISKEKDKYKGPIQILIKHKGAPEIAK